jgi:hypothetical protein
MKVYVKTLPKIVHSRLFMCVIRVFRERPLENCAKWSSPKIIQKFILIGVRVMRHSIRRVRWLPQLLVLHWQEGVCQDFTQK